QYSVSQHLLRDRSRDINARQIRVAQNNQQISDIQFEQQLINLVSQAQNTYWDLVYAQEDIKVKARSKDLAEKTLDENKIQAEVGTMAPIDEECQSRREQHADRSSHSGRTRRCAATDVRL